ncbi:hypothetical protein [Microbacterium sp.]|uniref:hypothetical protein n=1 Tax=Microbacterium sp. TaxID=51671 RepID=UPI000926F5AA|nr:hypothetical protein [Microbacterium sp.]MBN9186264.1 hypothetical protein [Microbacterium sp.]MBN9189615.1 hypothetical protein [Microbacterium sp.]MBN9192773.1 hypothetical protein [Microbacterium sp.]OJU58629.1 MAG: hypothetical protein BGO04_04910 [Microbacterium sp. 70-38]
MAIELNRPAYEQARALIREGKVVRDERDDWSEAAPTADEENGFIESDGWTAYSHWHLGVDRDENPETKQAYSFPYGDFRRVHRSGVIAAESRAGQYDHAEVEDALKKLLALIDDA